MDYIWGDQQQVAWNSSFNPTAQTNLKLFIPASVKTSYIDIPKYQRQYNCALQYQGKQISHFPGTAKRINAFNF